MLTTPRSGSSWRLRTRDVAVQRSAQSRSSRMQLPNARSCSATQASAHAVHACAHSTHAWMHTLSGSAGANGGSGLVRSIRSTVRCMAVLLVSRAHARARYPVSRAHHVPGEWWANGDRRAGPLRRVLAGEVPRDDAALDLTGALEDVVDLGVAVALLDGV